MTEHMQRKIVDALVVCALAITSDDDDDGYCNHVFALMYLTRHISSLDIKSSSETTSKTSQPQERHKLNRMTAINDNPIMRVVVFSTCSDETKGVNYTLYDACKKHTNKADKVTETEQLRAIKLWIFSDGMS